MIDHICKLLGYILHPLLMPTITFTVVYFYFPQLIQPMTWLAIPFLFFSTFLVPALSIYMMKMLGSIASVEMKTRQERIMPFFFITLFYGMTAYTFIYKIQVNQSVAIIFLSTCGLLVLISLVTLWFKISVHAAGVSGVLGLLLALTVLNPGDPIIYPTLLFIVFLGLIMTARLRLQVHTPLEVWSGALLGGTSCYSTLYFFS